MHPVMYWALLTSNHAFRTSLISLGVKLGKSKKHSFGKYFWWKRIWIGVKFCWIIFTMILRHRYDCIVSLQINRVEPVKWDWESLTNNTRISLYSPHGFHKTMFIYPVFMMTSSNGNIFRVTGHLCGEFTGPRWIPHTKASDAELWCLLWSAPE